jgi:hypothetical protein
MYILTQLAQCKLLISQKCNVACLLPPIIQGGIVPGGGLQSKNPATYMPTPQGADPHPLPPREGRQVEII